MRRSSGDCATVQAEQKAAKRFALGMAKDILVAHTQLHNQACCAKTFTGSNPVRCQPIARRSALNLYVRPS